MDREENGIAALLDAAAEVDAADAAAPDADAAGPDADAAAPEPNQGTKVDEWTPLVKAALTDRFGAKAPELFALLQETGGLVSGGFVLAACVGGFPVTEGSRANIQDTDIYVPVRNITRFNNALVKGADPIFKATEYYKFAASLYCKSFLRKNGIKQVYNFTLGPPAAERRGRWDWRDRVIKVDVMSVRNKRSPLAVVNNFDLTFCQVWFDGLDVYASHPEHVRTKSGVMNYEYCMTLFGGNRFLKNRLRKYVDRGFTVTFDQRLVTGPAFQKVLDSIGVSQTRSLCWSPLAGEEGRISNNKWIDPDFAERWYQRVALRYILGKRDEDNGLGRRLMNIPLLDEPFQSQIDQRDVSTLDGKRIADFQMADQDGYDSEDMDTDTLKALAIEKYVPAADEGAVSDELKAARTFTNLVTNSHDPGAGGVTLANMIEHGYRHSIKVRAQQILDIIDTKSLRSGDDLFGGEGKLYDIHNHDIGGGVTRESLETYLRDTMAGESYDVKCYYSGAGCTKKLTLREIQTLVSPAFYAEYSKPRPVKSGLDLEVDNFEAVFRNVKTVDPQWGNIYHATMCPYCLKFEERGEGCAVMTHTNPSGKGPDEAPYCVSGRAVPELIAKYKAAGARLDGASRLEFCVECGRPSSMHKHFNLDQTAMIEPNRRPVAGHPGRTEYDYGSCPGGGRVEMIARMMAVRDVYRRRNIRDVVAERRAAALAAEAAPLNAALMARAGAVWAAAQAGLDWAERKKAAVDAAKAAALDAGRAAGTARPELERQERDAGIAAGTAFVAANPKPADLSWDIPAPKTKMYADPLYRDAVNDPDYTQWLDGPEAAVAAAAAGAAAAGPVAAGPGAGGPGAGGPGAGGPAGPAAAGPAGDGAAAGAAQPAGAALLAADAALRRRPDVPANVAQREWNEQAIQLLHDRLDHINLDAAVRDQLEILRDVAQVDDANIPEGGAAVIDINLANAFAMLSILNGDVVWKNSLAAAIMAGGGRVRRGIHFGLGREHDAALDALTLYIAGRLAPAGGSKSFRRRRGKTPKKTRLTRRR